MATNPQFVGTPRINGCIISVANTARDGSGTLGSVLVAGASGSRVDRVKVKAQGTTTAGMVRFFTYDGANYRFITEVSVSAATPSATVQAFEYDLDLNLFMPNGYTLYASTHNAETFYVTPIIAGDF